MNDPERLLLGAADEHERALLSAAVGEEPSALALARLQRSLGLAVDPSPLAGPRPLGSPREPSPAALPGRWLFASKWLLLGSAGLAVVGALALTRTARSPHPATPSPPGEVSTAAPLEVVPKAAVPDPLAPKATTSALADDSNRPLALRDELLRLELVRTELRGQRAGAAQRALDEYDRLFARGTLREEALALRIETSLALHEPARAAELARAFFAEYPHSVHGARVRGQLEQHGAR